MLSFCYRERVNLLLMACFVVEQLDSKAWLKSSWCDPGCSGHCRSVGPWLSRWSGGPDGDDPATPMVPYDAVGPADAPVIQDEADPVITNAIASMCDGDPDDVAPKIACADDFQ